MFVLLAIKDICAKKIENQKSSSKLIYRQFVTLTTHVKVFYLITLCLIQLKQSENKCGPEEETQQNRSQGVLGYEEEKRDNETEQKKKEKK